MASARNDGDKPYRRINGVNGKSVAKSALSIIGVTSEATAWRRGIIDVTSSVARRNNVVSAGEMW